MIDDDNSEAYANLQRLRKPNFNPNNPNDYLRNTKATKIVLQDAPNQVDLEKEVLKVLKQNTETKLTRFIC